MCSVLFIDKGGSESKLPREMTHENKILFLFIEKGQRECKLPPKSLGHSHLFGPDRRAHSIGFVL